MSMASTLMKLLGYGSEVAPSAWKVAKGLGKRGFQAGTTALTGLWGYNELNRTASPGGYLNTPEGGEGGVGGGGPEMYESIPQEYFMGTGERMEHERKRANVMLSERGERQRNVSGGGVSPSTELLLQSILTGQFPGADDLALKRQMLSEILFKDKDRVDKGTMPTPLPNSGLG